MTQNSFKENHAFRWQKQGCKISNTDPLSFDIVSQVIGSQTVSTNCSVNCSTCYKSKEKSQRDMDRTIKACHSLHESVGLSITQMLCNNQNIIQITTCKSPASPHFCPHLLLQAATQNQQSQIRKSNLEPKPTHKAKFTLHAPAKNNVDCLCILCKCNDAPVKSNHNKQFRLKLVDSRAKAK